LFDVASALALGKTIGTWAGLARLYCALPRQWNYCFYAGAQKWTLGQKTCENRVFVWRLAAALTKVGMGQRGLIEKV
jgi:hypothetical protein